MTLNRLPDYLDHMRQAVADAQSFTEGMAPADFMQDKRTQQAMVMCLIANPQKTQFGYFDQPARM